MNCLLRTLFSCLLFLPTFAPAQNNRISTSSNIGWYNYFGTIQFSDKAGVHTEYQWRRDNIITDWQQSLLRIGLNYNPVKNVQFRFGYGWIETFNYGEIPVNSFGKTFTEHRIFEMVQLNHAENIFAFSHRFMLEQRFVGRYTKAEIEKEDDYLLQNRFRYMFRVQFPLKGKEISDKTPYLAVYDEIFIGFGKNVNANIFDQNRIGLLAGFRFNKTFRLEGGYLNQTVQFGRTINSKNVYQYNNGIIINAIFMVDTRNKNNH